jgi:hypothetical protein
LITRPNGWAKKPKEAKCTLPDTAQELKKFSLAPYIYSKILKFSEHVEGSKENFSKSCTSSGDIFLGKHIIILKSNIVSSG